MPNTVDFSGKPFHFIGIGGIGMSALAYVLAKRKIPVSGSDVRSTPITQRLQAVGAHLFRNQNATNLEFFGSVVDASYERLKPTAIGVNSHLEVACESSPTTKSALSANFCFQRPQVVCSTAINPINSEYQAALQRGYPIFHRSDLLAALIQEYQSIAVAGTHGKTTTSSLIGYMLLHSGLDPTIVVGGEVDAWGGNARLGHSPYLVAEADESDGSLAKLAANIGVVTNIELDHPDHYQTLAEVVQIFQTFADNCQTLVGCIDCKTLRSELKPTISYSLNRETKADYSVDCITYGADGTTARVWEGTQVLGNLQLRLLGKHNLSNALAAVAVGRHLDLEFEVIAKAIATFEGAKRRFEYRGICNEIAFVDDYAHHPSEIQATLAAARLQFKPPKRIVAIFQPHRYSRTLKFLPEFAQSFSVADIVVVCDIYGSGESNLWQITGEQVYEAIALHHDRVYYQPNLNTVSEFLLQILQPGDLALFLGAGNLNQVIPKVMELSQKAGKEMVSHN
ncbi:MAG: UDP-N-acetylmuramate--L-alanine ligase [Symploca sp. SIO3C6]|uniref:UDP-N-acetylmuramate--L-alanine ligase n=1 Tax=Symploca sp. SIO1C4 TaxID=2607765 RepID=A0A6B3N4T9_9CYAN|nr:UDP-N-acetylmuramate--L-alanine ligase [Symploca sp. SIO3C6]NER28099.1 UDP-N-acetylmuramate--L-alanine ligase [Symploca sp. SIO1C4]NET06493.1 UDP-N-acetylmuramate--L-alanine ligase [Symploca sp. SIO2B6]NET50954.1 UDP-N-acetylmuramate--L-alanine ligase [Merismopedia sp. SIO2A8]